MKKFIAVILSLTLSFGVCASAEAAEYGVSSADRASAAKQTAGMAAEIRKHEDFFSDYIRSGLYELIDYTWGGKWYSKAYSYKTAEDAWNKLYAMAYAGCGGRYGAKERRGVNGEGYEGLIVYIDKTTLNHWTHMLFNNMEASELPPIPPKTVGIYKKGNYYCFDMIGDPPQIGGRIAKITDSKDGAYTVLVDEYIDHGSDPSDCPRTGFQYTFTLTENKFYDSRLKWDLPFAVKNVTAAKVKPSYVTVNTRNANIRSAPSGKNSKNIIAKSRKGEEFNIVDFDGTWYKIEYYYELDGKESSVAYIRKDDVTPENIIV